MFGIGKKNRTRVRNDTFGSKKLRNAALAGVGMLAWQWWRKRQSTGRPFNNFDSTESSEFSETTSPAAGRY